MQGTWWVRALSRVALFVVGAVLGLATTVTHASSIETVGWTANLPALSGILGSGWLGFVLGVIACGGMLLAVRLLLQDRWAALVTGVGILLSVLVISGRSPGGSVIVPNDLLGVAWTWTIAGMVLVIAAWPDFAHLRLLQQQRAWAPAPASQSPHPPGETAGGAS